jgi:molybdopterin-binding protein
VAIARTLATSPGLLRQVKVALDVGGCPLLARITCRSAIALGLRAGLVLYAQIKGAAILG